MMVDLRHPVESYLEAARIYFDCRRRALTVRSSVDCLVAQVALDNKLVLLHSDRDFDAIARVRPLRTLP
jgi:predicted nucleic acid-binding protein